MPSESLAYSASDPVRDFVLREIASGALRDGQRLPTERDLAQRFQRSRGTVRKTLALLEAEARIVRRVGSGTYVAAGGARIGAAADWQAEISPAQLIEARLTLEPQFAALVALNATAADFEAMDESLRRGREARDIDAFESADRALHLALARATHNNVLRHLYELMDSARQTDEWGELKIARHTAAPGRRAEAQAEHERLVAALRRRDQTAARQHMHEHLLRVRQNLLAY